MNKSFNSLNPKVTKLGLFLISYYEWVEIESVLLEAISSEL